MKLNPDCIRDILIALESLSEDGHTNCIFPDFATLREHLDLMEYSENEIEYHLHQCDMNDFLIGAKFGADGSFSIKDISPKAHEFLANIRSDTVYTSVKNRLKQVGIYSLKSIVDVASTVASDFISGRLL